MPRDGSNIYSQPFPDVVEDTTIESTVYNGFTNDVAADLNAARPIVAGGTGATNAHDAMVALGGEIAKQQVTNFDSHPWVNGSFYSDAGATGAPEVAAFTGIYYEHNNVQYATIEARAVDGAGVGKLYVRPKIAGVWGAWVEQAGSGAALVAAADAAYVNITGDTMTGALQISYPGAYGAQFVLNNTTDGFKKTIRMSGGGSGDVMEIVNSANTAVTHAFYNSGVFQANGAIRSVEGGTTGTYHFGNTGTKYLYYDGTNFNFVGGANVYCNATVYSVVSSTTGVYQFGNSGGKYLSFDGTSFSFAGGSNVYCNATVYSVVSATTGTYQFGSSGGKYLSFDGTNFSFNGGPVYANSGLIGTAPSGAFSLTLIDSTTGWAKRLRVGGAGVLEIVNSANTAVVASISDAGICVMQSGYMARAGTGGAQAGSVFNFNWVGALRAWIDTTDLGQVAFTSDYRIKKDITNLPSTWETVKALRPIKYTQAEFSPPSHVEYIEDQLAEAARTKDAGTEPAEVNTAPLFAADDIERWGFIAHELQETLTPSAATAVKDAPDAIQSPNPFTIIAALTKALQEAMARIEALEASG